MAQHAVARQGSKARIVALILLLTLLGGCAGGPGGSSWRSGGVVAGNWFTIGRGDTLGEIARQAGVPLVRLQRFNPGVEARHLAIGQRILVPSRRERAPSGGPYRYQIRPGDTYYSVARYFGTTAGRIQAANHSLDPSDLNIGQLIKVPLHGGGGPSRSAPVARLPDPGPLPEQTGDWAWPLSDYRIVRYFGTDSRGRLQPMLLATQRGSVATAVADGQVRFANSMRQLGKVIIVHHPNNLQSVYALCSSLKVSEGQAVKTGMPICAVGYSGDTERYDLLFDVRHGGKPIDPRKVLR